MNNKDSKESELLSPEKKLQFVGEVFEIAQQRTEYIISGSLSSVIAENVSYHGVCKIGERDIETIHDIDLATVGFPQTKEFDELSQKMMLAGFELENHPLMQLSIYNQSIRSLLISEAQVEVNHETYRIRYTTPIFLLLSLVDQGVTNKTPQEKMKNKISQIQNLKGFSLDDFKTAARNEVTQRRAMNQSTFNKIQDNIRSEKKDPLITIPTTVDQIWQQYESLFDEAEFHNKIHSLEDLEGTSYDEIRKISDLEKFVSEF